MATQAELAVAELRGQVAVLASRVTALEEDVRQHDKEDKDRFKVIEDRQQEVTEFLQSNKWWMSVVERALWSFLMVGGVMGGVLALVWKLLSSP